MVQSERLGRIPAIVESRCVNHAALSRTAHDHDRPRLSNGSVDLEKEAGERLSLLDEGRENGKAIKHGPPPLKPGVSYINPQEDEQMELFGYRPHCLLTFITWVFIGCTGGILRLLFHWKPAWMLYCTHVRCSLESAKKVLLMDQYHQIFVEAVKEITPASVNVQNMLSVAHSSDSEATGKDGAEVEKSYPNISYLLRPKQEGGFETTNVLQYFENKKVRYLWDPEAKEFVKLHGFDKNVPCSQFHNQPGLSVTEQVLRRILYGDNVIVVQVQSIFRILFQEVLEPFYVFQVFSVFIWYMDNYVYYATCIIVMSVLSLATSTLQIRKNQKALRDTVHASDIVTVCRGKNDFEDIPSEHLTPGDVIAVPRYGCIMQCDAVLISGNCIVNESMLTGESVPVTKTPLPNPSLSHGDIPDKIYHPKEYARHTLFCGTKIIQSRYYGKERVKAVVIRTGYQTAKGELVRSIMFPKPVDFKFNRHVQKFIGCLAGLAMLGFIYTVVLKVQREVPAKEILIRALDLVTIVIPPALPAAMTIGVMFAQSRLKRSGIYCISPRSINISGCINCVCFDKTGTLTEDGLDLWGIIPVLSKCFQNPVGKPSELGICPFLIGMASCHSLTIINHELTGDPLDLKMFLSTGWELEEPEMDDTTKYDIIAPTIVRPKHCSPRKEDDILDNERFVEVGILRQFPFSSSLQRMSVIVRVLGAPHFELYAKGAPEMITSLCDPSTVPNDFSETLKNYTQQGFRVLALAHRALPRLNYAKVQRIPREDLEVNLHFLGLLIMENRLKPKTTEIIGVLRAANIRSVMVTGDNMLTALSVARDCGMIDRHHQVVLLSANQEPTNNIPVLSWDFTDFHHTSRSYEQVEINHTDAVSVIVEQQDKLHLVLTGKTFAVLREHYPDLLSKVAVCGTVFARMAPEQKQQLIELLQELGYYVGMCGDGANDCGALKAAHAGVSLSEAEASVASPFTSKTADISCIPILIREGRAALVTSFGVLKYMACYSMTQFASVVILYTLHSNLTDAEFLYIDLFLITIFASLFGRTEAYDSLVKKPPPSSLIGITSLSSLFTQVLLVIMAQLAGVSLAWRQPWYEPHEPEDEDDFKSFDNYAIFCVSVFQYITLAVIFSKGAPYRKSIFTNKMLLAALAVMMSLTMYLVVYPFPWLANLFELQIENVPLTFRLILVSIAILHFILSLIVEAFVVGYLIFRKCQGKLSCRKNADAHYRLIEEETRGPPTWLPTSHSPTETSLQTLQNSETTVSIISAGSDKTDLQSPNGHIPNLVSVNGPFPILDHKISQEKNRSSQGCNGSIKFPNNADEATTPKGKKGSTELNVSPALKIADPNSLTVGLALNNSPGKTSENGHLRSPSFRSMDSSTENKDDIEVARL